MHADRSDQRVRSIQLATGWRRGTSARLAVATYSGTALALITAPSVARALGPAGRGGYAAVLTYANFVVVLLGLGINLTVSRLVLGENRDPRAVLGACIRFGMIVFPLSVAAGVLVATVFLGAYEQAARYGAFVFAALAPLGIVQLCLLSLTTASSALGTLAAVRIAPMFVNLVGVVGLELAGALTLGTYLAVTLVGIFITLALSACLLGLRPRRGLHLRPILGFGLRAYPASLGNVANSQLDQLLIAPFLGPTDLGHYAVAVTLSSLPMGIVQALSARYQSEMTDQRDGRLLHSAVAERIRISALVSGLSAVLMAPLVPLAVPLLFGEDFAATTPLCLVLLVGCVAQGTAAISSAALIVAGRQLASHLRCRLLE
jgi:O-antigen/teichoic acid export membrane protein